jgi:outer membrane protein assembly factor BamB
MQTTSDWPQWRGPGRDGRSLETGLLQQWPAGGPPLAWKAAGAGTGYSSMVSAGGRVYTLGARGGAEYVVAFDLASGKKLWEVRNGGLYSNDRGDGPRSTPTLDGDRLYVLGASGDLSCLQTADGTQVWTVNVFRQFGGRNPRWGLSESPLVAGDRLLVNAGGRDASIVALDKRTGKELWRSQSDEAGYSSAVLHPMGGVQQAIFFTGQRAVGVDVRDGRLLWEYAKVANRVANIATPIVRDDRVFLSSDYGTGAALLRLQPSGDRRGRRGLLHARDAQPPLVLGARRRSPLRLLERHPHRAALRRWADGVAGSERGEGLGDLRGQPAVSLQRERRRRPRGGVAGRLQREGPVQPADRRRAHVEPPDHRGRPLAAAGPGHDLRVRRPGEVRPPAAMRNAECGVRN